MLLSIIMMTLYIIGLGLGGWKNISLSALNILRKCEYVFLDAYTSYIEINDIRSLEKEIHKEIIILSREDIEEKNILLDYLDRKIALLVPGDPFMATTHQSLAKEYIEKGGNIKVLHGPSIICAAMGSSGLHSYKFGPISTIVRPEKAPSDSAYKNIVDNIQRGLHTLLLLEYDAQENYLMTPFEALNIIENLKNKYNKNIPRDDNIVIIMSNLGYENQKIGAIYYKDKIKAKEYGAPAILIITGKLHFTEKEYIKEVHKLDIT